MHKRSCLFGKGASKDSSTWSANLASTNHFHGISKLQCIELGGSTWYHLGHHDLHLASLDSQFCRSGQPPASKELKEVWKYRMATFLYVIHSDSTWVWGSGVTKSGTGSVSNFELAQSGQWVKVPGMHSNWVHGKDWSWWTHETLLWILYKSTWLNRKISDTHFLDAVVHAFKTFQNPKHLKQKGHWGWFVVGFMYCRWQVPNMF